jgi:hypothetical protein
MARPMLLLVVQVNPMSSKTLVVGFATALAVRTAAADPSGDVVHGERPSMYSYAWHEPGMLSVVGVGLNIGGGLGGFTSGELRNTVASDLSGLWTARATFGTHIPLGVDVTYNGTAVDVQPLGEAVTGTLLGTNVEAALRWNILPHYVWNPYVFAGAGWQRYDVTDADFSRAATGIADEDDLVVWPMGAGLAYRDPDGIVAEVRGTFRLAQESELLRTSSGNFADLHTWDASAQLGYEF